MMTPGSISSFINLGMSPEVLIQSGWCPPQFVDDVLPERLRAEVQEWGVNQTKLFCSDPRPSSPQISQTARYPLLIFLASGKRDSINLQPILPIPKTVARALKLLTNDFLLRFDSTLTTNGFLNGAALMITGTIYRYHVGSKEHQLDLHTEDGFAQYIYTLEQSPNLEAAQLLSAAGLEDGRESEADVLLRAGRAVFFQEYRNTELEGSVRDPLFFKHGIRMRSLGPLSGWRTAIIFILH